MAYFGVYLRYSEVFILKNWFAHKILPYYGEGPVGLSQLRLTVTGLLFVLPVYLIS